MPPACWRGRGGGVWAVGPGYTPHSLRGRPVRLTDWQPARPTPALVRFHYYSTVLRRRTAWARLIWGRYGAAAERLRAPGWQSEARAPNYIDSKPPGLPPACAEPGGREWERVGEGLSPVCEVSCRQHGYGVTVLPYTPCIWRFRHIMPAGEIVRVRQFLLGAGSRNLLSTHSARLKYVSRQPASLPGSLFPVFTLYRTLLTLPERMNE